MTVQLIYGNCTRASSETGKKYGLINIKSAQDAGLMKTASKKKQATVDNAGEQTTVDSGRGADD